jgi:hypothetical protein
MLKSVLVYLVPFVLTLAIAGVIRFLGGPERGARVAGVAVMIGFTASWVYFVRPGWMPVDDLSRIVHVALGASVVGLVLDLLSPRRLWAAAAAAVVVIVCTWSSVTGTLMPPTAATSAMILPTLVLGAVAFLVIARLDAARKHGITALVLLAVAALGLSAMAAVAGEARLATTGLVLASAIVAFGVLQSVVALPVNDSIILGTGSVVLALAWALGNARPEARLALLLVLLIFFAEGTARRVPLPKARISAFLYPLILAVLAGLPVALSVLVVYVTARIV